MKYFLKIFCLVFHNISHDIYQFVYVKYFVLYVSYIVFIILCMVFSISKGLGNSVCGHSRRISRTDIQNRFPGQHLDRCQWKFCLWTPQHNFRQIDSYIVFFVWGLHCIFCMVFSFSKGLILNYFGMCGTLERADSESMEPIQGRLRNLIQSL